MTSRTHSVSLRRRFWKIVLRILIWLFVRVEVRGVEHVPAEGAGIAYYNHIHWLDPPLVSGKLPRYNAPLTKHEARSIPIVGLLLRGYQVIFIKRGLVDREALSATWKLLADGGVCVMSPEGTRSADARLHAAKDGLAFVGRRAPDAWWLPCAVTGTPQFRVTIPIFRRSPAVVTFGRPFRIRWPAAGPEKASREDLRAMTDEAMVQLAALLPLEMRGDYAAADPAHCQWLEFLE